MYTWNFKHVRILHTVAGCFHAISVGVLIIVAIRENDIKAYNINVPNKLWFLEKWLFTCVNTSNTSAIYANSSVNGGYNCTNRSYKIEEAPLPHAFSLNTVGLAVAFGLVSAGVHFLSALFVKTQSRDAMFRLCLDYAFSAPCMLALINLQWGANCIIGVCFAPLILGSAIFMSYFVLDRSVRHVISTAVTVLFFVGLIMLYVGALIPSLLGAHAALSTTGKLPNEGTAPAFVAVFMIMILISFSLFIIPYSLELFYKRAYYLFYPWLLLSLGAKTTLHTFLVLNILAQAPLRDSGTAIEPERDAFITVGSILCIAGLLYAILKYGFKLVPIQLQSTHRGSNNGLQLAFL